MASRARDSAPPPALTAAAALGAAEAALSQVGHVRLVVRGGSMRPCILSGAEARIDACTAADLCPGDVVLARAGAGLRLHRVVRIDPSGVITRGDACDVDDAPTSPEDVLGRLSGFLLGTHAIPAPRGIVKRVRPLVVRFVPLVRRLRASRARLVTRWRAR